MSKVDNIEQKVIKIIADNQGKKIEEISVDSRFAEDLGVDRLSTVEIMMEIEKEFGVDVPDEEATRIKKVADVVKVMLKGCDISNTFFSASFHPIELKIGMQTPWTII